MQDPKIIRNLLHQALRLAFIAQEIGDSKKLRELRAWIRANWQFRHKRGGFKLIQGGNNHE